ncbi:glycoside hydrolase family 19 protein [Deinococcus rubellus]|uniref:glycoside hydrolase family 19 protein n=1 Tax=Deinococcus rubellus TaxID=1889240 RepID=UPI0031EC8B3D
MITGGLLQSLVPSLDAGRAASIAAGLQSAAAAGGITTPERIAPFVAQLAHESQGFLYSTELWGPTAAQLGYEGRRDLGNTQTGDGYRYRGRGWIMTTGRYNYRVFGQKIGVNLEQNPDRAADPDVAGLLAVAFWNDRHLNDAADQGNFKYITYRVNGGYNGYEDRLRYYGLAQSYLTQHPEDDVSKLFFKDMGGKNVEWDGQPTVYGGIKITRFPDGSIQLERVPVVVPPK